MRRVRVEYEIELPLQGCSDDEIEEWLRFALRDNGSMSGRNPLVNYEPEPIFGTFEWDHC